MLLGVTASCGDNWVCTDSECATGKKYQSCSDCPSRTSTCGHQLRVGQSVVYQCSTGHNEPSCASIGIIQVCQ